jgi:hypothetical protein
MANDKVFIVHSVSIGDEPGTTRVICHLCGKELESVSKGGPVEALNVPGTYADLGANLKGKARWELVGHPLGINYKMCTPPQA